MLDALKRDTWPRSHYDVIEHYYAQYDKQIASGEYQPFLYPWGTLGAAVVIIYLLIPHQNRPWLKKCRFLAFAWITGFAIYTMTYTRAKGMAPAFGIGLISSWSVAWCSAILVCNDCQTDFQRIERREGVSGSSRQPSLQDNDKKDSATVKKEVHNDMTKGTSGPSLRHGTFAWQPYPLTPFIERVDWVLDIFCNFRGAGWNWRTSALPPPPKLVQKELGLNSVAATTLPKTSNRIHAGQVKMYTTRRALVRANAYTFITGYFLLDLLKTLLMHDAYFWSPYPSISHAAPKFYPSSPTLMHIIRLTLSMLSIQTALSTIFSLGPMFFCGMLGPSVLGARAEPFMYPDAWASYTVVLDKGLAGWWGNWWHQTFRFAFSEPGRVIVAWTGLDKQSVHAKAMHLAMAFGMSGVVHACGSLTSPGSTRPFHNSFTFFIVQAAGVWAEAALELLLLASLRRIVPPASRRRMLLPAAVSKCCTFVYVHAWFYFTAHLLCDDFARGGIWLFEPVPFSVFRGWAWVLMRGMGGGVGAALVVSFAGMWGIGGGRLVLRFDAYIAYHIPSRGNVSHDGERKRERRKKLLVSKTCCCWIACLVLPFPTLSPLSSHLRCKIRYKPKRVPGYLFQSSPTQTRQKKKKDIMSRGRAT